MVTIFVSYDTEIARAEALKQIPTAVLVEYCFDILPDTTGYTSLREFPDSDQFLLTLKNADLIYYVDAWEGTIVDVDENSEKFQTLCLVNYVKNCKNNVVDLHPYQLNNKFVELVAQRQTSDPQLWVAGCSISHGHGVNDDEKYGAVLAKKLNVPVSFLTWRGSSIAWAADQILRSDIRPHDYVVWGLTFERRFPYWARENIVNHVSPKFREDPRATSNLPDKVIDKMLADNNMLYQSVTHIYQVYNFCKKIGVKLLIFDVLSTDILHVQLTEIKNFKLLKQNKYLDLGSNNTHPGPLQHQQYAEFCYENLVKLYGKV